MNIKNKTTKTLYSLEQQNPETKSWHVLCEVEEHWLDWMKEMAKTKHKNSGGCPLRIVKKTILEDIIFEIPNHE